MEVVIEEKKAILIAKHLHSLLKQRAAENNTTLEKYANSLILKGINNEG